MLATDITDLGILCLCIALSVAIVMVARFARFMRASVGSMNVEVGQINRAVNHVEPGEPTLIQQVRDLAENHAQHVSDVQENSQRMSHTAERLTDRLDGLTVRVDRVDAKLNHMMTRSSELDPVRDHTASLPW